MNNKGQSLVLFVLLIPVIFMIIFMVYEIGKMTLLRQELDNISYLALDYGIDNIDKTDVESMIKEIIIKNKDDIDNIDITTNDDKIYVNLEDGINSDISIFSRSKLFKIKSSYVGYISDGKKIIERNK